jgi:(1->4)-alpha-D-glucan 1-alpha-D-glucosylmutase
MQLLGDRAASPALYADGTYEPLDDGRPDQSVLAFMRRNGPDELAVAVPRLTAGIAKDGALPIGELWGEMRVGIPPGRWRNIIEEREIEIGPNGTAARELFAALPVSVLRRTQ